MIITYLIAGFVVYEIGAAVIIYNFLVTTSRTHGFGGFFALVIAVFAGHVLSLRALAYLALIMTAVAFTLLAFLLERLMRAISVFLVDKTAIILLAEEMARLKSKWWGTTVDTTKRLFPRPAFLES